MDTVIVMTSGLTQVSGVVSLADQARESIRTAILDGIFAPEQRVTIEQISAELGISRTPIREALKALEGDGLVQMLPYRGAIVSKFAREELDHRYSVRAMLEGYAAELACVADAEGMAKVLRRNVDRAAQIAKKTVRSPEVAKLVALNQEFHGAIREGAHSPTVSRILDQLRNPVAFSLHYWSNPELRESSIAIHSEIADAFTAADPALARALAERHMLESRDIVLAREAERPADGAGAGTRVG